ncbi:sensor histidine kinase [Cellulosimicrobium sp. SH8]|uniref:sensor histidine kinase n=1 Tax=Cellulosimicrobium sp. SH8 TaxID=2952936 RepID=UPI0021F38AB6|nr:histidine kinase [Cellulosimicrobium sp. SH8]
MPLRPPSVVRASYGVALGACLVPMDALTLLAAAAVAPFARTSSRVGAWRDRVVRATVRVHVRRLGRWLAWRTEATDDAGRPVRYLAARLPVGVLSAGIVVLLAYGAFAATLMIASWAFDLHVPSLANDDQYPVHGLTILSAAVPGAVLLYLALMGLVGSAALERAAASRLLGAEDRTQLLAQIETLTASRSDIVAAVEAERRRVERDLHDGVQQQVVALGMLLDRGRRTPDPVVRDRLLAEASDEASRVLTGIRDVAWRVHPAALDTRGLRPVLARLAARAMPPARLDYRLDGRLRPEIEACVYYVVSEALMNVTKHADATRAAVAVTAGDGVVTARVTDDGRGGATARGGRGLAGLAARTAALGGSFDVDSPRDGPTTVTAVLPCV